MFVGVVSHTNSRFAESQGPLGLAAQLAHQLPAVTLKINTENLADSRDPLITPNVIQQSLTAQLQLEDEWSRFLGHPNSPSRGTKHLLRRIHRLRQRIHPPPASALRRLLNIELSHRDLMHAGLTSGSDWVLILEDDAFSEDITDLSLGLHDLMESEQQISFVNLSRSFTLEELGVKHQVRPSKIRWAGRSPRHIVESTKPITNTVCAILYHRSFLKELVASLDSLPLIPVVPIDWKINSALISLFDGGRLAGSISLTVEPAPITQMSMHDPGILRP